MMTKKAPILRIIDIPQEGPSILLQLSEGVDVRRYTQVILIPKDWENYSGEKELDKILGRLKSLSPKARKVQ